jgi:HPt (histidine-containing phosphotransfer) domain-containing protein
MKLFQIIGCLALLLADVAFAKSGEQRRAISLLLWTESGQDSTVEDEKRQLKDVLDDPLQTHDHKYLASGIYTGYLVYANKFADTLHYCELYPPQPEYFEYRANCVIASDRPILERAHQLEAIAEEALRTYPDRTTAAGIFTQSSEILRTAGHTHESIRAARLSFESIPPQAEQSIATGKQNLAGAYANVLLSPSLQRLSLQYYSEVRDWFGAIQPPTTDSVYQMRLNSFNVALVHLLLFRDYDQAIVNLDKAVGFTPGEADIPIFKAYAWALKGNKIEARKQLQSANLARSQDPTRLAFLRCYYDLTRRLIGDASDIQSCLRLELPTTEILLDLTTTLSGMSLDPKEENMMWRMFYRFFMDHLKPDYQNSMASAAAEAELQQQKAESRLKDLKLKNMKLYQNLSWALFGIALFCSLALFFAVRSWRSSRRHANDMRRSQKRLQNIMESIEEGLVQIRPDLHLTPEKSRHLEAILGRQDLSGEHLDQLLARTDLSADAQSQLKQCLGACWGEGELAWELNQSNLPTAVRIDDKDIAFYWQPQMDQDVIVSVLLVMRNVTTIKDLQRLSERARQDADRILIYAQQILACHPRAVSSFLQELPGLLDDLHHAIVQSDDRNAAGRLAHRLKGSARTLGLKDLQDEAHRLEDAFQTLKKSDIERCLEELSNTGNRYTKAMEHILGKSGATMEPQSLLDLITHYRPALEQQLAAEGISLARLQIDEAIRFRPDELISLNEILLHGLTNAADHGFILPHKEGRMVPAASFAVTASQVGNERILTLRDNGVGLDFKKLQTLADKRRWTPGPGQSWSDVLFLAGVSTADQVTHTSGRGVGLAAIRSAVQQMGGAVELLNNEDGPGTTLRVRWPLEQTAAA